MSRPTEIEIIVGERAAPDWLMRAMLHLEQRLNKQDERITTIMSMQERFDADLLQMNADLQSIIAQLKAQSGSSIMDFSNLDTFASNLHQAATGTPAPASAVQPEPAATASTPVDTGTSAPGAGPGTVSVQGPFYTFTGTDTSTIDTTHWTLTDLETTDTPPKPLYTFTGDTPGGSPTGADAQWQVYTGTTQSASASTTTPANEPPAANPTP